MNIQFNLTYETVTAKPELESTCNNIQFYHNEKYFTAITPNGNIRLRFIYTVNCTTCSYVEFAQFDPNSAEWKAIALSTTLKPKREFVGPGYSWNQIDSAAKNFLNSFLDWYEKVFS